MTSLETIPVVVITGSIGVGKTTITQHLGDLLGAREIPHTIIDMDWLRDTFPQPADDRFNERLGFRNLADVARNSRAAGSGRFVIADVVEARAQADRYREAIPGSDVIIVRLVADEAVIQQRIEHRGRGGDLEWERQRAVELDRIMDEAEVADITIDTSGSAPSEIAMQIVTRLGWCHP